MNLFDLVAVLTLNKKDYEDGLNDAEKEASSFGDKLKSGLGTVAKVGGASLAVLGASTVAVTKSLLNTSAATAELGDHIDKQSQKIGISAKAYQEWDFILTHNGASVDSLQASMKAMSTQAQENAEEFQALGISEEELGKLGTEELFARVIQGLQGMEAGTKRTAIASKLLGRGATELAPVLNSTSEELEAMRQQAHDLGKVMSDEAVKSGAAYEDSLYNLQTAIGGLKNRLGTELLPSIVNVMDGITGIFTGDESAMGKVVGGIEKIATKIVDAMPKIAEMASKIISNVGKALIQNLPKLTKAGVEIVKTLMSVITENLPMIFDMGLEILMTLLDGLLDALPQIINGLVGLVVKIIEKLPTIIIKFVEAIPTVIDTLISALVENLPMIIQGLITLVMEIVKHTPEIILGIIQELPNIIQMIITGVLDNVPLLVQGAIDTVVELVKHLPEIISGLIAAIPGIIGSIVSAFGPLGEALGGVFSGVLDVCGGILGELGNVAEGVFNWIGTLMDDPAKALEQAFDGIKDYATKVFESVKQIITGIFDLIDAKKAEAEARERKERVDQAAQNVELEKGIRQKTFENGSLGWEVVDEAKYLAYYGGKDALGLLQNKETKLEVSGTIKYEGVNDKGQLVGAGQMTEEQLARMFQTQGRLYG